jgi:hypothetical protein
MNVFGINLTLSTKDCKDPATSMVACRISVSQEPFNCLSTSFLESKVFSLINGAPSSSSSRIELVESRENSFPLFCSKEYAEMAEIEAKPLLLSF